MTPEAQRIAIAEACGWIGKEEDFTFYGFTQDIPMKRTRWLSPCGKQSTLGLPDYLNDLNAMHEAEKMLNVMQWSAYTCRLNSSMAAGSQSIMQAICHATAAQRAEAFLRTVGKWDESK